MIDSVTYSDKVIVTKGGQQMGPTLTVTHWQGGELLFIISKGRYLSESRKFSTVLYLVN